MTRSDVLRAIYDTIERANELRESEERLMCAEETPLYGRGGALDSLGLVALVLDVEQTVSDQSGVPVCLADDRALSLSRSPFRNVGSFADHVMVILNGSQG